MYNIVAEIIIALTSLTFIYNLQIKMNYLIHTYFPYPETVKENFIFLIGFYTFVCENNPLLLDYYDLKIEDEEEKMDEKVEEKIEEKVKQKYEDKYLEKFKRFSNEFYFTELELEYEKKEYERIKMEIENKRFKTISELTEKLAKINEIEDGNDMSKEKDKRFTENINEFGLNKLLSYFGLQDDDGFYPEDIDFEELYMGLVKIKNELNDELIKTEKIVTDNELKEMARKSIINIKLDKFVDNYILENTPMGNIYMRYNNSKGSFEYFSNNTIPYRYLEPVGRKYVMTYWCKPIFVDIEEELKIAEIKYNEDKQKKENDEKRLQEEIKNNPKNVLARMKNYNKDVKQTTSARPMKNRSSNNVLPPQIKSSIQNMNQTSEKQLLKEKSNRYTWEGRLADFCPLKKIDKKVLNKNLLMTYADFKRIQQEQQNKK